MNSARVLVGCKPTNQCNCSIINKRNKIKAVLNAISGTTNWRLPGDPDFVFINEDLAEWQAECGPVNKMELKFKLY